MPSVLRSVAALAFVSFVAVLSAPGCSQQGEGERCDSAKNGDADCDSGLSCVKAKELLSQTTDRCCPADGQENDARCTRGVPSSTGGSSTGGSSTGGTNAGGEPATSMAGAPEVAGGSGGSSSTPGGAAGSSTDPGAAGALSAAGQGGAG
jgi:hypothetical protein